MRSLRRGFGIQREKVTGISSFKGSSRGEAKDIKIKIKIIGVDATKK